MRTSRSRRWSGALLAAAVVHALVGRASAQPAGGPAQGFDIHIAAPHVVDGMVMGPFHHYCKQRQAAPLILECLLYESTATDAPMVGVEYFIDKQLTRANLPLETWNRYYHDHEVEIASGRVAVLDRSPAEAEALAAAAARTDGIIWKLWLHGTVPDGRAIPAQSVGHRPRSAEPTAPVP
jgi:hypothetical protein